MRRRRPRARSVPRVSGALSLRIEVGRRVAPAPDAMRQRPLVRGPIGYEEIVSNASPVLF